MPGLVGIFDTTHDHRIDVSVFQQMVSSLMHRKWYRTDAHTNVGAGVAIARIHHGIINPEPQPYVSDDGRVRVFLDGEVHNEEAAGQQLKWVAAAYQRHGADFPAQLNGSFAVIVLDEAESRVLIATDRTASRPLFSWHDGTTLYVAPELKALLAVPGLRQQLDWRAIAGFLASGFWLNGYTPLSGVRRVDHATVLTLSRAGLRSHRYWEYRFVEGVPDRGERYYRQTLAELVRTAVRRQVRSPHRYGVLLSGGYDSRGLLGCYLEERPNAGTVTISWGEDEQVPHSDCWVARRVAARVGVKHQFYRLRPEALTQHLHESIYLSDGMTASCDNYPEGLAVFAAIREELGVQILLRGDECMGWHSGPFDERTMLQSVGIRSLYDLTSYRRLLRPEEYRRLANLAEELLAEVSARCSAVEVQARKDFFYLDQRLKYYLHPLNYFKTLEVEVRRPYLDNDILDFVTTLPVKYRLDKALFRRTIARMFPGIFEQSARHGNLVDWHRRFATDQELRGFVRPRLAAPSAVLAGIVATTEAARIFPDLAAARRRDRINTLAARLRRYPWLHKTLSKGYHRLRERLVAERGAPITPNIIFRLLTLMLWCERFLDDQARIGSAPTTNADTRPPLANR
jgi:asparagine synthase (glutamine-hydrolysing)